MCERSQSPLRETSARNVSKSRPFGEGNSPPSARDVLARDIKELRRVFHVPNNPLKELIQMNKNMYLEAFKKTKL